MPTDSHPADSPVPESGCQSCGLPQARSWSTPQGTARLCPGCATLHGLGCP